MNLGWCLKLFRDDSWLNMAAQLSKLLGTLSASSPFWGNNHINNSLWKSSLRFIALFLFLEVTSLLVPSPPAPLPFFLHPPPLPNFALVLLFCLWMLGSMYATPRFCSQLLLLSYKVKPIASQDFIKCFAFFLVVLVLCFSMPPVCDVRSHVKQCTNITLFC